MNQRREFELLEGFPEKVYTLEDVQRARKLIESGYKHQIKLEGKFEFKRRVKKVIELLEVAGHLSFLRSYVRAIVEIQGVSQLRETEAVIWANLYTVADAVEAAAYFIEKAHRMKNYIDGKPYSETEEIGAVKRSVRFLKALKARTSDDDVRERCEAVIDLLDGSQVL